MSLHRRPRVLALVYLDGLFVSGGESNWQADSGLEKRIARVPRALPIIPTTSVHYARTKKVLRVLSTRRDAKKSRPLRAGACCSFPTPRHLHRNSRPRSHPTHFALPCLHANPPATSVKRSA